LVVATVLIIIAILILVAIYAFSGTAYDIETREYHQDLLDALKLNEAEQMGALKELAKRVGAGTVDTVLGTPVVIDLCWFSGTWTTSSFQLLLKRGANT